MFRNSLALAAAAVLLASTPTVAQDHAHHQAHAQDMAMEMLSPDAASAAATVDAFQAALKAGDTAAAAALLAEDVLIFEGGRAERSREEYASHHLISDAAFISRAETTVTRRAGWAEGDVAWITSEGRVTGESNGRQIDRLTTETMVLRRHGDHWMIHHIHWSSRAAS